MEKKADEIPKPTASTLLVRERAAALIGRVISDRYRILELVAMGGMGAVYRGEHVLMKKRVAIKILHPMVENMPEIRGRFEREAIAGAHVQHPNVASATDFGELPDGSYFLVLEYVRGATLHQLIQQGPMEPTRAARIARQLATALHVVHKKGIVHRDLKPRNVMVSEGGEEEVAKIIDFGLAKVQLGRLSTGEEPRSTTEEGRLTGVGQIFGTIAYLAPEAALGMDAVDGRSDLYAVGLLFYEMLAGKHPFEAKDSVELFKKQRYEAPRPIGVRTPGVKVPPAIEAVVMRLLAKSPEARFQTGLEVVEAIDAALEGRAPAPAQDDLALPASAPPASAAPASAAPASVAPESAGASEDDADDDAPTSAPPEAMRVPVLRPSAAQRARRVLAVIAAVAAIAGGAFMAARARHAPPDTSTPTDTTTPTIAPTDTTTDTTTAAAAQRPPASAAPPDTASAEKPEPMVPASAAASAEPQPTHIDGIDANGYRALLVRAAHKREWPNGESALMALAKLDRASFRRPDVVTAAREVTVGLENAGEGDKVFGLLSGELGTDGLDVLYEIIESRGGTRASERAAGLLRDQAVMERATPALRVAFALREASCADKLPLLDRAVEEGDARALVVLQSQGVACFKKNKQVERAIRELKIRLSRP